MPEPVSSRNASQCPLADAWPQEGCDATVASCPPPAKTAPEAPVIDLDPVIVHAEPGVQALVNQYTDRSRLSAPVCQDEADHAQLACEGALLAAAGTLILSPTGVGLVMGSLGTMKMAVDCGETLAKYSGCIERSAIRQEAQSRCEADGGVALQGFTENELICWVRP